MSADFKTQTGCRVRVRPAPALGPDASILSLRVDHPAAVGYVGTGDAHDSIQYAEVMLTADERRALAAALAEEGDRG
ncbi:hypothetical protein SEA_KOZIE_47 [Microbacterium phage Kozie]|uniref:Uncharacterized protein n=1 Tax=Microbacterium phage Kozie TaxID=2885981 RepID=A0AAE8Y8Y1_9CAUD|nr:hypothetical protein QC998_gp47 [Microbacterium phage Kozie]UDL16243.1 hypothetical protein SEA_KOZIE_47 [Microbacterium phage Kozie]